MSVVPNLVYISIYVLCAHQDGFFQLKIALLMYCELSVYDMITSRAMRIIWDVCAILLPLPGVLPLGVHYLVCGEDRGGELSPSFSVPFSPSGLLE